MATEASGGTAAAHSGTACGLRLTGAQLPGLLPDASQHLPTVDARRCTATDLDAAWADAAHAPRRVFGSLRADGGGDFLTVDQDPEAGVRVWAHGHGTQRISADGMDLEVADAEVPSWASRRLLASQALPVLSTLRGHEVLHAGAVVVEGRLLALSARSGTGKSSTLAHLVANGGGFFADDVLAVEVDAGGRVLAHPGPRLLNIDDAELARLAPAARSRLGDEVGRSDKAHLAPDGPAAAQALDALVFLERAPPLAVGQIDVLSAGLASRILSTAYLRWPLSADRAIGQLAVAAAIEAGTRVAVYRIGGDENAAAVADGLASWTAAG